MVGDSAAEATVHDLQAQSIEKRYRKHPGQCAARLAQMRAAAAKARARGDRHAADRYEDEAGRLEAVLAKLGRCRRCGRTLTDPESVQYGLGPDCRGKAR